MMSHVLNLTLGRAPAEALTCLHCMWNFHIGKIVSVTCWLQLFLSNVAVTFCYLMRAHFHWINILTLYSLTWKFLIKFVKCHVVFVFKSIVFLIYLPYANLNNKSTLLTKDVLALMKRTVLQQNKSWLFCDQRIWLSFLAQGWSCTCLAHEIQLRSKPYSK